MRSRTSIGLLNLERDLAVRLKIIVLERGHWFTEATFEADLTKKETSSDLEKDNKPPKGRVITVDDERFHSTSWRLDGTWTQCWAAARRC